MSIEQLQHWLPIANAILSIVFLVITLTSKSLLQAVWRGAIFAAITFSLVAVMLPIPSVGPWKLEALLGTIVMAAVLYGIKKLVVKVAAGLRG